MYRKDYLQRQFEEFGKVLALILGFKRNNDWDNFEKEIRSAAATFSLPEIEAVERMDQETFNAEIIQPTVLSPDRKKILATLLFEKLGYYLETGREREAANLREKCLALYGHLRDDLTENQFDLDIHYKLDFLNKIR